MTPQTITAHDVVTFDDVKLLAGAAQPCVTIVVHIANPLELSVRLKNAIRNIEKKLGKTKKERASAASLLQPVRDLEENAEKARIWCNALILFRSPDVFQYFSLYRRVPEVETVEARFQVRALLAALAREQRFHLLCLSQRHIRLLHCTQHRAEEAAIRGVIPQDLRVWLNIRQPDHVLDNRSVAGPSVGGMKGVSFGTSTDREREDQYLSHFFKEVDRGVNLLLREDPAPLLLAGVETEVAAYRRVTTYPRVFEKAVYGSPNGLPPGELHARAMDVVTQTPSEPLARALAEFQKHSDAGRTSSDARQIVKAAWEGRVADLFVREGAELRGTWNEEKYSVDTDGPGEDLLNAAALKTVQDGGRAFVLEARDMPAAVEVAAALRF